MKYKEQQELVRDLRAMADFFERPQSIALPKPTIWSSTSGSVYGGHEVWDDEAKVMKKDWGVHPAKSRENMKRIVRAMGSCEKKYSGSSFSVSKSFGDLELRYNTDRQTVCRPVETGEVVHHKEYVQPAYDEKVVEWICDEPLLSSS